MRNLNELSEPMKSRLLEELREQAPAVRELAKKMAQGKYPGVYVMVPMLLGMVFDYLRWNVFEKRFDMLIVGITDKPSSDMDFPGTARAAPEDIKHWEIPLDKDAFDVTCTERPVVSVHPDPSRGREGRSKLN